MSDIKSTSQWNSKSTPLALSAQVGRCNQYVSSDEITKLVINIYKTKGGRGITYTDLIETGLAKHKAHSHKNYLTYFLISPK
jgi:hypothetical protein